MKYRVSTHKETNIFHADGFKVEDGLVVFYRGDQDIAWYFKPLSVTTDETFKKVS